MRLPLTILGAGLLLACGGKQTPQPPQPELADGSGSAATTAAAGSASSAGSPTCVLEQAGVANVDCGLEWLDYFAQRMCTCTTQDCAKGVSDELAAWSSSLPDSIQQAPGTEAQNARGTQAGVKLGGCISKLYGVEPSPEDGSGAPPAP